MVIRVWALWGNSKIVGAILVVLSIIGVVVTAISYALFSGSLECEWARIYLNIDHLLQHADHLS